MTLRSCVVGFQGEANYVEMSAEEEADHLASLQPPAPTADELKAYAADKRYRVATGGIVSETFGPLLTDRATQSMLARAIQSIDLGIITAPIRFKGPGGFVDLDRTALVAISTEVAAHVQAAFDEEATVLGQIEAETITTIAAVDAAAWPSNG